MTIQYHDGATTIKSRVFPISEFKDRDDWIELLLASELSLGAKVVGVRIAHHHNIKSGRCNPSIATLILGTGMSDSSVRRAIRELEAGGWFRVDRTLGRHSNSYELMAPTLSDATGFNPATDDRVNPIKPDRVQNPTLSPVTPQPCQIEVPNPVTIDRQNHESRTTNRTMKEIDSLPLDLGDDKKEGRRGSKNPSSETILHDADFAEWWNQYPKKVSKLDAERAYRAARKKGATREALLSGVLRYAAERRDQGQKYTKNPATWLNGGCWLDESVPPIGTSTIDQHGNPVNQPPPPDYRSKRAARLSGMDIAMAGYRGERT